MATLIPSFGNCSSRMTNGEKRLAQRLEEKLEEDYLLWYDVPIGLKRLHPDFIVLHPSRGIFILEVKDWTLDMIRKVSPVTITCLIGTTLKEVKHPLQQARDYVLAVVKLLSRDKLLVQSHGSHKGNLACPYSYGVVLTNITRRQFESEAALSQVFEPHLVICQDEMYETVDPYTFQERLWNFCTYQFGEPLTKAQIDRIRWHLFPEVRIGAPLASLANRVETEEAIAIPDILRVMDLEQEQLARSLKDGHRVIHGVAGSGKTLILVYRCLQLVKQTEQPILVLCFNVSLAAKLRQIFHEKEVGNRVTVRHFHGWCIDQLWQHRIQKPSYNQFKGEEYVEELVQRVIQGVDSGGIPSGRYGAVMIDEGHDFEPGWLKLLTKMVSPETKSLLLLYDDAQSIYDKREHKKFSFKSVGIQAQGRTTVLKVNYRNTEEILNVAYDFAKDILTPTEAGDEDAPILIQPQSAGRHGHKPELIHFPNFNQEVEYLAGRARQFYNQGQNWNEMAIVYRSRWIAENIGNYFRKHEIPVEWVNFDSQSRNYKPADSSVKLVTMHSSKGLEFPVILIPGVGRMPDLTQSPEEEARLLYVGMTRAIDQLVMTCDRSSEFVNRIEAAVRRITLPG
jgi:hypothetical protein